MHMTDMKSISYNIILIYTESCTNEGQIRLEGSSRSAEGRVEICEQREMGSNLEWRLVCNAGWDENEATVVCEELGFSGTLNRKSISLTINFPNLRHTPIHSYSYS